MKRLTIHLKRVERVPAKGKNKGKIFNTVTYLIKAMRDREEQREISGNLDMHQSNVKSHYLSNVI